MTYKVKTLNNISEKGLGLLGDNYVVEDTETPDAILVRSFKMHEMEMPETLKFIGRAGAGVNNIPLDKCSEAGIVVCNSPGANANAVKELVLTGMFLASRKVYQGIEWVNSQKNSDDDISKVVEKQKKNYAGPEIKGKKLGIIGLGAIGVLVANAAIDLGMEVYGYDPFISIDNAWGLNQGVNRAGSKDFIFAECDYVSLHLPLLEATKGYVDKEVFENTKEGLKLLNFARGGLVNEDDLEGAIAEGIIGVYVTDFPNNRTLAMDNVINIPHLGASTPESEENCATMAVNELKEYIENGNIINSVNYPDANQGICPTVNRLTVNHKNIPNTIGQLTAVLADKKINIADMLNKSKGDWAYTIIDVDTAIDEDTIEVLKEIEGVVRVRVI